ncbi:MAG: arylsulfatase [Verrucomicrobiae bacterium]|nr:arylsulfatase [Verrucomicrobiae bacterium]
MPSHSIPSLVFAVLAFLTLPSSLIRTPAAAPPHPPATRPNLVYILTDDQGYGDVSSFHPTGRIRTPHLDRLAREGLRFTDAHSGSSVCTPTRYGILTGRYAWRSRLAQGVLGGLSPHLIPPDRLTLAAFLQSQGYRTACIGKWHLGMDWSVLPDRTINVLGIESRDQVWNVDFAQPIRNGPNPLGFHRFYGISASLDMVPYAYIENDRVTQVPDRDADFPWFHGRDRRTRRGPTAPGFDAMEVLPEFTRQAVAFVEERAADARAGRPFFLYLALASPHTPIVPTPEWQGHTRLNAYADFTVQTDAAIGEVLSALRRNGLESSTLVAFAADNGCSPEADFPALAAAGHHPSGPFRGHKADIFEGGHRVPFIARWPGRIPPGSHYPHPVSLNDLFATVADILDQPLPPDTAEDSVSLRQVLFGTRSDPVRESIIHHSINGTFALREGPWKLILAPDSGGWSEPRPGSPAARDLPPVQLYHLERDPGERDNLHAHHPEIVQRLVRLLEQDVARGRSTPGPRQANDRSVDIWRGHPPAVPSVSSR